MTVDVLGSPTPKRPATPPRTRARLGRVAAVTAIVLAAAAAIGLSGRAATSGLPDPCAAIPGKDVAAALDLKQPPASSLATITNVETCTFARGALTVSVGFTSIAYPAPPKQVLPVAGLPNGTYRTYAGTNQTEILFLKGPAAHAVFGVVRNFATISRRDLAVIAKDLYASIGTVAGGPSVGLVNG